MAANNDRGTRKYLLLIKEAANGWMRSRDWLCLMWLETNNDHSGRVHGRLSCLFFAVTYLEPLTSFHLKLVFILIICSQPHTTSRSKLKVGSAIL